MLNCFSGRFFSYFFPINFFQICFQINSKVILNRLVQRLILNRLILFRSRPKKLFHPLRISTSVRRKKRTDPNQGETKVSYFSNVLTFLSVAEKLVTPAAVDTCFMDEAFCKKFLLCQMGYQIPLFYISSYFVNSF